MKWTILMRKYQGAILKKKKAGGAGRLCRKVLIHGATEQWRFACSKTHAEMDPAECSFAVRKDRVTLKLRKAKDEEVLASAEVA